jgi:hypothetical protein
VQRFCRCCHAHWSRHRKQELLLHLRWHHSISNRFAIDRSTCPERMQGVETAAVNAVQRGIRRSLKR